MPSLPTQHPQSKLTQQFDNFISSQNQQTPHNLTSEQQAQAADHPNTDENIVNMKTGMEYPNVEFYPQSDMPMNDVNQHVLGGMPPPTINTYLDNQ